MLRAITKRLHNNAAFQASLHQMKLESQPEIEDGSEREDAPTIDPVVTDRAMAEAMERRRKKAWQTMTS